MWTFHGRLRMRMRISDERVMIDRLLIDGYVAFCGHLIEC